MDFSFHIYIEDKAKKGQKKVIKSSGLLNKQQIVDISLSFAQKQRCLA